MSAELRCSLQLRSAGASPVATAGSWRGVALVPTPLPWGHSVDVGAPPGIRGQAIVAPAGSPTITHARPDGPFTAYRRSDGPGRDLLVCTHGSRDRCCGSFGTSLWQELSSAPLPADVALWRTSHLGGHRFAPTVAVLPEGTVWGWVTPAVVEAVLSRSGPVTEVLPHYRGCVGLASRQVQALEAAVLGVVGWPLLDTWRRGRDLGDGRWLLETGLGSWTATVTPGRRWPVPDCGVAPDAGGGAKHDVELVVEDVSPA